MRRLRRGFSLAEVLTVLVILGLIMTVIAFSVPLALRGPLEAQSQVDNVNSAALALYKLQHDTRPSTIKGVFSCTTAPTLSCTQPTPGPVLPSAQSLVLMTADDSSGQFQSLNGAPSWQGFVIYWLTPNADNTSNELRRVYVPYSIDPDYHKWLGQAVTALNLGLISGGYTTVAQDIRTMSAAVDTTTNTVDLQLDGGDLKKNRSSLTLTGNSYVRN